MVIFINIKNACAWFLKKLNTEPPYDPAIPLGFIPQRLGKLGLKQILVHQQCMAASFTRAKRWSPSTNEWISKTCYIHTMAYYSTLKRNEILIHTTTWMNPEDIILSEISQIQKQQIPYDSIYMWYLEQ